MPDQHRHQQAPSVMPDPTPSSTMPPASPRRCGATTACTAGPASPISTPPAIPASPRHTASQASPPFQAQQAAASAASSMPASSARGTDTARATARASKAPAR